MDLKTQYLGLNLPHPLIAGASPMCDDLDMVKRLEDAGAAALVMRSLFEEQIVGEQLSTVSAMEGPADSFGEALSYFPDLDDFTLGPEEYLRHLADVKKAVDVPVIASLNGTTLGGWLKYAKLMADSGADALELNIYNPVTDAAMPGQDVEKNIVSMVKQVRQAISIPVAVKLSPFYSSLPNFARQLAEAGADGLVLFNRLYQPDIDLENMELTRVNPVGRGDLPVRLRWLGILCEQVSLSLSGTGGVKDGNDAVKMIMAGAHSVQMVSAILQNGANYVATVKQQIIDWMTENDYSSIDQMRGCMSMSHCPDPTAYKRGNYMKTLLTWRM